MCRAPEWIGELHETIADWMMSLADRENPGLFRISPDAPIPHDFPSSAVILGHLNAYHPERIVELTGGDVDGLRRTFEHVARHQRSDTGLFIDPHLDPRLRDRDKPGVERDFRRAVTHYTIGLVGALGGQPRYPYSDVGGTGDPDPEAYLADIRSRDWSRPWAAGSHAAGQTREMFLLMNDGRDDLLPYVREGIEFILSHQNPETGMWGVADSPLSEQISGTLKVLGRFVFYLGMDVPHVERLADSCIRHHADGGFYAGGTDMCFPRNVAEMCVACLVTSDYRRDELLATLASIAETICTFRQPDGAFASHPSGVTPIGWCGAHVVDAPEAPRGDRTGTQGAVWSLGMIARNLGWEELPWADPQGDWRDRIARLRYRVMAEHGRVGIVPR